MRPVLCITAKMGAVRTRKRGYDLAIDVRLVLTSVRPAMRDVRGARRKRGQVDTEGERVQFHRVVCWRLRLSTLVGPEPNPTVRAVTKRFALGTAATAQGHHHRRRNRFAFLSF